jgi:hypothetical protein
MKAEVKSAGSQLTSKCPIQYGRKQGVQLGGCLRLQPLQRVHLRLQCVQLGHDPALLREGRLKHSKLFQLPLIY